MSRVARDEDAADQLEFDCLAAVTGSGFCEGGSRQIKEVTKSLRNPE